MFDYKISVESFADDILDACGLTDEIVVNPDEVAKADLAMTVIYGDKMHVDYANGNLVIPFEYMGNKALERFAITLLLFKMYYRDDDGDANTSEYDMAKANEFIGAILMPKKEFTRLFDLLTIKELAEVFGVSETLVRFRANRLKLLKS